MPDKEQIYLDYAAATPLDERVLKVMQPYLTDRFYNPSAMYQSARQVKTDIELARAQAAKVLGVKAYEIIFTAGATESINIALKGVAGSYGGKILTSNIEHEAVISAAKSLDAGLPLIKADTKGYITAETVEKMLDDEVVLVSIGYVNNELGTVQPIKDIAAVINNERKRRLANGITRPIFFHTDASQATGLLDISVARLGIDLMTLNAGKCYGPKQVGLLWRRPEVELTPLILGGGQESGLRSGTENVAGVIGFAEALRLADKTRKSESQRIKELRDELEKALENYFPDLVVNGHHKRRAPHILHISLPDLDGERAVFGLDEVGVLAATGSACAANRLTRSHVLEAVDMSDELADGSLRFSLGRWTTQDDIERAGELIHQVIKRERGLQ